MPPTINVLDKGFVSLIDSMGNDLSVVNAARVSFNKHKDVFDSKDEKLIKFLASGNPTHFSPFTHVQIQLRIKMPLFVARQYFKHQVGLSRNEISRRYVTDDPEFHVPSSLRHAASEKKQGSSDRVLHEDDYTYLKYRIKDLYTEARELYLRLLEDDVCPEQARMVLPVSMYTEFIETGSLYAYARIVKHRANPTAQKEIQEYANAISALVRNVAPVSWEVLTEAKL